MKKIMLILAVVLISFIFFGTDVFGYSGYDFDTITDDYNYPKQTVNADTNNDSTNFTDDETVKNYGEKNKEIVNAIKERYSNMSENDIPTAEDIAAAFQYTISLGLSMMPIPEDAHDLYNEMNKSWEYYPYGSNYALLNSEVSVGELFTILLGRDKETIKGVLFNNREDGNKIICVLALQFASQESRGTISHIWVCYKYEDLYFLYSANGELEGYIKGGVVYPCSSDILNPDTLKTLKRILKEV